MKLSHFLQLFFLLLIGSTVWCAGPDTHQHLLMDYNWKFAQSDVQGAERQEFDDTGWRTLNLPHDWSIEGEFKEDAPTKGNGGFLPAGIGWYRKHLDLPAMTKGRNLWIEFDGVYMNSDVWVNGEHLGRHPYGYTSFNYNVTRFIKKGENIIAVRVDNSLQPNSRWYSGSGIYRHVWLNVAGPVHIAPWGTYITTPSVDSLSATIGVLTSIENNLPAATHVVVRSVITSASGDEVAVVETPVSLAPSGTMDVKQTIKVAFPSLWSIERPSLYALHSSIVEGPKIDDALISPFGIRSIEYDRDKGFLLNGKHVKMHGMCLHHDAGCLGAAVPEQAWKRRLQILKEMGCNAIRTAHNPPAPEFLDLCDSLGFLVMDEAFDEWEIQKGQVGYSYHLYFAEHSQSDLISMIHRDRNHPSVVLWSAGNEVLDQGTDRGTEVLRALVATFHREDPTRPVTVANDRIADVDYPAKPRFLELEDIVGYNYVDRWLTRRELYYSVDRHDHPDWKMIGTENVGISGVRGKYTISDPSKVNPDRPIFSYDYNSVIRAEQLWRVTSVNDYVIGDFMWTGIDYLGEARWPRKSSSSGVLDLCGFPKDGYYFYQSQWTDKPMVHLFPHWNWAGHEGRVVPVIAFSNCDTVELFLNGKSFGAKSVVFPQQGNSGGWNKFDHPYVAATTSDLHLSWDVPYEPGTLKAIGKKDGQVVTEEVHTTSGPAALRLSTDRSDITADARDIANIKVEVVDDRGLLVPDANNLIEFKVEGEGTLAGTDNGDPQDRTRMKSTRRNAFNGMALAVIQSTVTGGIIRVTAVSADLKPAALQVRSHISGTGVNTFESLR
jgi:beta-galactosidase